MDLTAYHKQTSSARTRPKVRRWRRVRRLVQVSTRIARNPRLGIFPFVLIVLIASINFATVEFYQHEPESLFTQRIQALTVNAAAVERAEVRQKTLQAITYSLLLVLILAHIRAIVGFFWQERTFLILSLALLVGMLVSDYPVKVVTNVVHALFGLSAAFLFLYPRRHDSNVLQRLQWGVLIPTALVHAASLLIWLLIDINRIQAGAHRWRYGGLAGNPNNMGSVCMLTCWAGFSLAANRDVGRRWRLAAFGTTLLALASAYLTDSVTTFVVIAALAALTLWNYFITAFPAAIQRIVNIMLVVTALGAAPIVLVITASQQGTIVGSASESLTGDSTLTGRTEIWEIGKSAILDRPIFGWSYDTHQTVFDDARFALPYNQYHNGYIDTIVAGGLFLFAILCWQMSKTLLRCAKLAKHGANAFSVLLFVGILMLQNFSEWSLLRPINPLWLVYTACAIAVAMLVFSHAPTINRSPEVAPVARRRSRRPALRF